MMRYQHPSERGFGSDTIGGDTRRRFSEGQRCYCFSSSESSTSAATNAASDNADIVQGGAVTKAGDFSDVQSGGVRNESTGSVIALENGARLNTGVDLASAQVGHDVNVTTSDPQLVGQALAEVSRLGSNFSGTIADLNTAVLGKLSDLALSQQTQGESTRNNTILYISLAALAVLGLWVFRKR